MYLRVPMPIARLCVKDVYASCTTVVTAAMATVMPKDPCLC